MKVFDQYILQYELMYIVKHASLSYAKYEHVLKGEICRGSDVHSTIKTNHVD